METLSAVLAVARVVLDGLPDRLGFWSLVVLASVFVTWGGYLSIMHLKSARDQGRLTLGAKILGYPWLAVCLVLDVVFNLVVGTLLFLELPRELLFTSRVSRLNDGDAWRGHLARWFCRELLDPFDPAGKHCR